MSLPAQAVGQVLYAPRRLTLFLVNNLITGVISKVLPVNRAAAGAAQERVHSPVTWEAQEWWNCSEALWV